MNSGFVVSIVVPSFRFLSLCLGCPSLFLSAGYTCRQAHVFVEWPHCRSPRPSIPGYHHPDGSQQHSKPLHVGRCRQLVLSEPRTLDPSRIRYALHGRPMHYGWDVEQGVGPTGSDTVRTRYGRTGPRKPCRYGPWSRRTARAGDSGQDHHFASEQVGCECLAELLWSLVTVYFPKSRAALREFLMFYSAFVLFAAIVVLAAWAF